MTTQLSTIDYINIANCIYANRPEEDKTFELEYETPDRVIYVEVSYGFDTRAAISGSYENYDLDTWGEVYNEYFDVVSYEVYDIDGEIIETDFNKGILLNLLNN